MLTPRQLAVHLVRRGILPTDALVDEELTFETMPGRNYNHRITTRHGSNLLAKQACDSLGTLRVEAEVYEALRSADVTLTRYLPRMRQFDRRRDLLLLDLVERSHTIASHVWSHGRINSAITALAGRALGTLHRSSIARPVRTGIPWVLMLPRPPLEMIRDMSAANMELLAIVQESEPLCHALDDLAASWRDSSMIHNDLRWSNLLVSKNHGAWQLTLIDWELAGIGDPDWDVGSVFSNFLATWIFSMSFRSGVTPELLAKSADRRLSAMRPAIRAFWNAYVATRAMNAATTRDCLIRAVRFAAARLIELTYERQQSSTNVTGNVVCAIQTSENVLRRPEAACTDLLGLEVPSSGA